MSNSNPPPSSRFYGRRKGRPLRTRKSGLLETLLPRLRISLPRQGFLDPRSLFAHAPQSIWLEIGFGGGEHLAEQAVRYPDIGFLGCEPFVNGVASLLDHVDCRQIPNIRIYPEDARHLLDALPDHSLDRCYVLFADPWPKARHAERRFIGPENLPRLARVLKPGAELRLATDDPTLRDWMREHVQAAPCFELVHDGTTSPCDWIPTRYEQKGRAAGREPVYLTALARNSQK